ncbi:hypothetical protein GYMLUDRAFT_719012 [Collybiopsis luxurians FD-317 M1]|nr:hypothetical protein GYMLUDRAFT_719012 [Collybiopsis luxurians FD-317 M1]
MHPQRQSVPLEANIPDLHKRVKHLEEISAKFKPSGYGFSEIAERLEQENVNLSVSISQYQNEIEALKAKNIALQQTDMDKADQISSLSTEIENQKIQLLSLSAENASLKVKFAETEKKSLAVLQSHRALAAQLEEDLARDIEQKQVFMRPFPASDIGLATPIQQKDKRNDVVHSQLRPIALAILNQLRQLRVLLLWSSRILSHCLRLVQRQRSKQCSER